ncbi:N-acetylmuramoyl-L-alanine amidase AmiD [Massilia sp. Bi118]|uniref:N-acetylmuramoyl-L-alanine amidase n=1 Tax=Massilia sp. Bi118 TaxID=2822346 RepID=UPI001D7A2EAD|nr:N-acetylmuramoyl-L-alanine amidase [Massilia sp. Bi118]CAH0250020.1 N-acetylmuramoyl-L-alanine amidase AmiD [Massilia sp. Bi118]
MKTLAATLLIALLAGCATGPQYDKTYTAKGQSSRARFLVLHYTVGDRASSLKTLTEAQVSAHYMVTDDPKPVIYNLVDEKNAAWHAGNSSWKNYTQLNNSSIGIEIVNSGWKDTPNGRVYAPFPQSQIDAIIPLVRDIVTRHHITPENVLGHSDIAPLRKQDPGPMFPWKQFADAGLVVWPDAARVALVTPIFQTQLPDVAWYQKKLATWGYGLVQSGNLDEQTRTVLSAFQMKYRPANIDGMPDVETAALLEALTNPAGPLPPVPVPPPVIGVPGVPPVEPVPAPVAAPAVVDPTAVPATPPVKDQH